MIPQSVRDYIIKHGPEILPAYFELVRFPSIANNWGQPDACDQAANWLEDYLQKLGMKVQLLPPRASQEHGKSAVLADFHVSDKLPTLMIYAHYDVQPPDPLDEWKSPPFEPTVRDGCVWGRGVSDDKGPLMASLLAFQAWKNAAGGPPVNIKFLFEGEEEVGSPHMTDIIQQNRGALAADAVVIADSGFFAKGVPAVTYSLRGLTSFTVIFTGPNSDVHSGMHGGVITNPINALARLAAAMHDADGRVTIPGFYDDVLPLSQAERDMWAKLPFGEDGYLRSLGIKAAAGGEKGYSILERNWARPTLDCNGIWGGYAGEGFKTVIPSQAGMKFSMRLVPRQDPDKIIEATKKFIAGHTPPGIEATVVNHSAGRGVLIPMDSPAISAAMAALKEGFGVEPAMIRCGASIGICNMFQEILGIDPVLMGYGLPDDNLHAPNEHFALEQMWNGAITSAAMMQNMAGAFSGMPKPS